MTAPRNLEVTGLSAELIGLIMLLLAALWQAGVTDWLDAFPAQSQYFIQETANLAALQSIGKISMALNESDPERRKTYLNEADDVTRKAMFRLVEIRTQSDVVENNQSKWLKRVRHSLFVLGAAFIILGKLLVLRHKQSLAAKTAS